MAKQLVNPFERHLEKGILAIAGLVLIGAVARYGVSTPNRAELSGETVTPANIDERVKAKADTIREKVRTAKVEVTPPAPLLGVFVEEIAALKTKPLPLLAPLGADVPLVDRGGAKPGQYGLVTVLTPPKPVVSTGRSVFKLGGGDQVTPTSWVTVSASINVKQQAEVQKKLYGSAKSEVAYGPFELQRRERRPDGSWVDADWKPIEPWPPVDVPNAPSIVLTKEGDKLTVPKDTDKTVQNYLDALSRGETQLGVLRPLLPYIPYEPLWHMPILTSYEDVLKQDDEYLNPNAPLSEVLADRYGGKPAGPVADDPAKRVARKLKELSQQLDFAIKNLAEEQATQAYNEATLLSQEGGITEPERQQAKKLATAADQAIKEIRRKRQLGQGAAPAAPGPGGANTPAKAREKTPLQQVWVHDAKPGSLVGGATYQYRIRARLFNRLAGDPFKFADPKNAAVLFIPSEWSEPSDPVTVAPTVEFFVTGDEEKTDEIKAEIFQWYDGVWLQSKTIRAGVGDGINGTSKETVPGIVDRATADSANVDFDAQVLVVDIDFKRSYRERKKGAGKTGVKIGGPSDVAAMVYLGTDGELHERLVPSDRGHPSKKAATERLYRPAKPK